MTERGIGRTVSSSLTEAVETSACGEVILCFATISHSDLADDIRVVSEDDGGASYKNGRIINYQWGGLLYLGVPFFFELVSDNERPARGTVTVPDVEHQISQVLMSMASPPRITLSLLKLSDFSDAVDSDNARTPDAHAGQR